MRNLLPQLNLLLLLVLSMRLVLRRVSALSTVPTKRIAVIGGGASGIFSAVSAVEHHATHNTDGAKLQVVVLEATSKTLSKVAISGGGRCNGKYSIWKDQDSSKRE